MPPAYAGPSNLAVPDPDSVQKTRSNEEPGGPADVAAVVAGRPERLGREIRHGGTDATGGSIGGRTNRAGSWVLAATNPAATRFSPA